jgi:hypothetical protein
MFDTKFIVNNKTYVFIESNMFTKCFWVLERRAVPLSRPSIAGKPTQFYPGTVFPIVSLSPNRRDSNQLRQSKNLTSTTMAPSTAKISSELLSRFLRLRLPLTKRVTRTHTDFSNHWRPWYLSSGNRRLIQLSKPLNNGVVNNRIID